MPDALPHAGRPLSADPERTVHWIGTGLSVGRSGLGLLCERAGRVLVWGRTRAKAAALLDRLGLTGRAEPHGLDGGDLPDLLAPGHTLVSMLPAAEHAALLRLAISRGAHFACTSYATDELRALAAEAGRSGLVVLAETGLDPGIDHLLAHELVSAARKAVGDSAGPVDLTSYCGGLPAVPNAFRYRFSWAPYGVLSALAQPARYIEEGVVRTSGRPWEATRTLRIGDEDFEAYPNRDSVPFTAQYAIADGWRLRTFIRGTLRSSGWQEAWQPVFRTVETGDPDRIRALARDLAQRYPATGEDRDRVVLAVSLTLAAERGGPGWRGECLLDVTGTAEESAMALCVSLPLAHGVTRVLDGALPAGLRCAAEGPEAALWLDFLRGHGIAAPLREQSV
ncbi:saccharopine dehydrogenase family protein [Streptomyces sp. NPDC051578]|uniref:saccharopine dehydrogenase family protein n=1 Tax=Streptomyces sp. NPDC051578 TaxID=3365662 RepID=UPI0037921985